MAFRNQNHAAGAEDDIWISRPSLWLAVDQWMLGVFGTAMLLAAGSIALAEAAEMMRRPMSPAWLLLAFGPLVMPLVKTLQVLTTEYRLTTQRLIVRRGILSKTTDEVELFRIRDFIVDEPFWMRLAGLGTVRLLTVDRTHSVIDLKGVAQPMRLRDVVREAVRDRQGEVGWTEGEVT